MPSPSAAYEKAGTYTFTITETVPEEAQNNKFNGITYDGTPKEIFTHYRELEEMGLAAPQVTYIVHELREKGFPLEESITTVDEACEALGRLLKKGGKS